MEKAVFVGAIFFMVSFLKLFFWKLGVRVKAESLLIGLDDVGREYW